MKQTKKQMERFIWKSGDVKVTKPEGSEWTKYGKAKKNG